MIRHGTPEPQVGGEKNSFQQHLPAVTSAEQKSPNPTDRNMAWHGQHTSHGTASTPRLRNKLFGKKGKKFTEKL